MFSKKKKIALFLLEGALFSFFVTVTVGLMQEDKSFFTNKYSFQELAGKKIALAAEESVDPENVDSFTHDESSNVHFSTSDSHNFGSIYHNCDSYSHYLDTPQHSFGSTLHWANSDLHYLGSEYKRRIRGPTLEEMSNILRDR